MGRDEERVKEEIAGAERPTRPRNLSSTYLEEATDALYALGDAPSLFVPWPPPPDVPENRVQHGMMLLLARHKRRVVARKGVLFAALAAEAYVNEFIAAHVPPGSPQYDKLDNFSPVNKYLISAREAHGDALFMRDREPMPLIAELFDLRLKLVHPKPGFGVGSWLDEKDEEEELFAATKLAEFIIAVSGAAVVMMRRPTDWMPWTQSRGRSRLVALLYAATRNGPAISRPLTSRQSRDCSGRH